MTERTRNQRLLIRSLVAGVIIVVALNVLGLVLDKVSGSSEGPSSSSYTTSPAGLAAYADLLSRAGHPIVRLRSSLEEEPPPTDATVVMLDAGGVDVREAETLRDFVSDGGRLIAGGKSYPAWLSSVVMTRPMWSPGNVRSAGVAAPAAEVDGVEQVRLAGQGYWSHPGSTLPVLADEGSVVASVESVGNGRVVLLADSSILHNAYLSQADNASFGLQAAGSSSRPVMFVESVHGYAAEEGALSAVPDRWLWTLGGLLLATFIYMFARGRRLGPPETPHRELPPPRRAYVDALGGILARTRDFRVVGAKMQRELRNRVARGATDDAEVQRAATAAGLDEEEARMVNQPLQDEKDLLVLGRAVATLEKKRANNRGSR